MRRKVPLERIQGLVDPISALRAIEVAARRQAYGANDIVEFHGNPWLELVQDTVRDPMIWFLVGTALLYLLVGSHAEAVTLSLAILPLAGMDAYLHRRTRASTEGLTRQLEETAFVFRAEGEEPPRWMAVPATSLVPGDLTRVDESRAFPADGIVVSAENVQVDESSLTGEAYPVRKTPIPSALLAEPSPPPVDAEHWGLAGTRLLTGTTLLRVVFTGGETLYGEIVRSARANARAQTPLQKALSDLVRILLLGAGILCLILGFVRMRQGHGFLDALVSAATLAVAALPEEFPVVFTVFLGVGVYRLARSKALVRRAVTVENIGRVTCICSDKTGTITEGRLALERLVAADNVSTRKLLGFAALASRRGSGDPIDRAIWEKTAAEGPGEVPEGKLLATFPYTEKRRRETSVVEFEEGLLAVTKGSPEVILEMTTLRADQRAAWSREVGNLASEGRKIIACASRHLESPWTGVEPDREYRLLGALLFVDPLRDGVREAIATCRRAGIRVLMITGDHPDTARAVAAAIGLGDGAPRVVVGEELFPGEGMTRSEALAGLDVVARAMPEHKLSLVQALQEAGEVVVVTGDGVNDVPALKAADIGVAMGERGTRSAREVASIVLLDDNFRSIVRAIAEGRQLFENLRLSFQYLLMVHVPLVLTATFIPLAGYPLLYLPLHIVWLEALIHPSALLVFQELPPSGPLTRMERNRKARFFGRFEWAQMGIIGMLGTILVALSYERSLGPGPDVEHARAMALVALTSFSGCLVAFLSRLRTWTSRIIAFASFALSALLVQVPMLAKALHVEPLHFDDWAIGIGGGFLVVAAPRLLMNALRRELSTRKL